jgi:hypothetical protein
MLFLLAVVLMSLFVNIMSSYMIDSDQRQDSIGVHSSNQNFVRGFVYKQ